MLIDNTWDREVSGGPMSWTQSSHLGGAQHSAGAPRPCQTHGSEEKEERTKQTKKKNTERKNEQTGQMIKTCVLLPRTNGKSKPIQTKLHQKAYTYTLTKGEKGEKKYIYIYKGREHPNQ